MQFYEKIPRKSALYLFALTRIEIVLTHILVSFKEEGFIVKYDSILAKQTFYLDKFTFTDSNTDIFI